MKCLKESEPLPANRLRWLASAILILHNSAQGPLGGGVHIKIPLSKKTVLHTH